MSKPIAITATGSNPIKMDRYDAGVDLGPSRKLGASGF